MCYFRYIVRRFCLYILFRLLRLADLNPSLLKEDSESASSSSSGNVSTLIHGSCSEIATRSPSLEDRLRVTEQTLQNTQQILDSTNQIVRTQQERLNATQHQLSVALERLSRNERELSQIRDRGLSSLSRQSEPQTLGLPTTGQSTAPKTPPQIRIPRKLT